MATTDERKSSADKAQTFPMSREGAAFWDSKQFRMTPEAKRFWDKQRSSSTAKRGQRASSR